MKVCTIINEHVVPITFYYFLSPVHIYYYIATDKLIGNYLC